MARQRRGGGILGLEYAMALALKLFFLKGIARIRDRLLGGFGMLDLLDLTF